MREKQYLRKRYAAILSSVGMILLLSAGVMVTPLLILIPYPDEASHALAFILPAGCLAILGMVLRRSFRFTSNITLSVQEGGIIVLISWLVVILFSAWPFIRVSGLGFSGAVFESVSGWTTTGLSVVDVASAGPMILLWRSVMQVAGGAGLAIIMMSAIVGPTGVGISSAEGRSDQLVPHVRQSARLVLVIYTGYAAAGTLAYWMAGMSLFDAVNHSFAAVSTGGFSTVSYGNWNVFGVFVLVVLMLVGGGTCSTAGGIKQFRVYLLWKQLCWDIRSYFMPRSAILARPV